ncbi:MAG: beta-galactosidase [Anaerolineaceae bacterium]|nr:beta-galactosidase [Anaerolineaceae bacterium]
MKIRMPYFPVGSSYYPPTHDSGDWARDIHNMRAAGFNMMRTAELISSWDYIEPRRGQPEWAWLDHTFELAAAHDIQIVLGTGSCNPPIWMLEHYPDLQRVSREGMKYPTNTVWGWACVNNPGLQNEVTRYLSLLLERYSQHPALYCWQIDNQIGHMTAFTEAEHSHPRRYGYWCYCDHCTRLFREYVRAKYGDIDTLNHAWSWDPTHYRYDDWHQITPPRSMPAEWGNNTAWLDFRIFVQQSIADFVRFQHNLIKKHDDTQITMHNLYDCMRPDLGARNEPNHWDIGGITDIIGHDIYPSEHDFRKDPAFSSWFFDFAYSVARHNDKTMWVPELESGPIGGFSAGPNFATTGRDIKRFNINCIGHGAKCMLYQGYRDWNFLPLTWGALVDFHGEPTERYHAAAEICRVIRSHEDFFLDALPPAAQIAVYHSHENVIVLDGQANEKFLYRALRGTHTALWEAGYTIQFVEPRFLNTATADYRVIFLPFVMHLPQAHADALTRYVENGGTLIGCAKLGHVDERGWVWNDRPGAGLTALFGAKETYIEVQREPHDRITLVVNPENPLFAGIDAERIAGYWHREEFDLQDDVEVLAHFVDGTPAIIRRQHGKGQAILMATHLDMAFWEYRDPALRQFFDNLMRYCGVQKDVLLDSPQMDYARHYVDTHLLTHESQHAVLVNNHGTGTADLTITIPGINPARATDLFSGAGVPFTTDGGARFSIQLPPEDGTIIMLE